jgi:hypothetical protein
MTHKPIICIDFDGVIHRYSKGWQGGVIYDTMTDGFINWAHQARDLFRLVIYSSRSSSVEGREAMREWLQRYLNEPQPFADPLLFDDFEFSDIKPPAFLTIDDRAVCFGGDWSKLEPEALRNFKPWNVAS